jgi:hypothetical protein
MGKGKKNAKPSAGLHASAEAKRTAHTVLEVLAGLKGPSEASEALSVSLQRYYVLETRALEGFVNALEPREKGKRKTSLPSRLEATEKERDRLKTELDRMRSLVRLTQRAVGLSSKRGKGKEAAKDGKKKRKRRKANRTRKVLARLMPEACEGASKSTGAPRNAEP